MESGYKQLVVWKKSMELVTRVYEASQKFPKEEIYGLTSQMRRSAVSIPSNIAEGKGRRSAAEFQHFLAQARGSLFELETQIEIVENLGYLKAENSKELKVKASELGKMLSSLLEVVSRSKAVADN